MGFSSVGFEPSPKQPVHDTGPSGATESLNVFWRMPTDASFGAPPDEPSATDVPHWN